LEPQEKEIVWPETKDVPVEILAEKVSEFCQELNKRTADARTRSLEAAKIIWPQLKAALAEKGRELSSVSFHGGPGMPEWANQPVAATNGFVGNKPRSKREAMEIALKFGDGGWATMGELWLWVGGGGPIVERTLYKYGYLEKDPGKGHEL